MSSMIYLYAFCLNLPAEQLPSGIQFPLQLVSEAGVNAVIEPQIDLKSLHQNDTQLIAAVLRHDQVIHELFQQTTLLPLRFGTQFTSETMLRSHLQTQATTYRSQLQSLIGKTEICLKLSPKPIELSPLPTDLKGRDYFLAKKQAIQAQSEQQQAQQNQLLQLQKNIAETIPHSKLENSHENRIYLLAEQTGSTFYQTLKTWQDQFSLWEITASTGLPPYHFV